MAEVAIKARLQQHNIPHRIQVELPVSTADFYFETHPKPTIVFLDGPPHRKPGRAWWDDKVRDVLARFYNVVSIPYDRPSRKALDEMMLRILDSLAEVMPEAKITFAEAFKEAQQHTHTHTMKKKIDSTVQNSQSESSYPIHTRGESPVAERERGYDGEKQEGS